MTAAFQVISTSGLAATTLADIAEVAGVSLGLLQHYFRQRDNLVTETFRSLSELSGAISRHVSDSEQDPLKRLLALIRLQVSGWAPFERRWSFWLEFWSAARRIDELRPYVGEIYTHWKEPFEQALTEAAAAGVLTLPEPLEVYSLKLMALIDGFAVRALVDESSFNSAEMADLLISTVSLDLAISPASLAQALDGLPAVIGGSYPAEPVNTEIIDWSPLDRLG